MGRPPVGKVAMTGAERTRLYRLKHGAETKPVTKPADAAHDALVRELAEAQAEIERLRKEAATAKPAKAAPVSDEMRELEGKLMKARFESDGLRAQLAKARADEPEQVRALRQRVKELEQGHARRDSAARAAQTKAEKPPLPPDEVRERQIKSLKTQVQNLKGLVRTHEQHYAEAVAKAGGLPRSTKTAIDKVLHPDSRRHATEADKNEASQLWNAWNNTRRR